MKSLFLSPSLSRKAGGIFEIMRSLAGELAISGVDVVAYGLQDHEWEADCVQWNPVPVRVFPFSGPAAFGYSQELCSAVIGSNADLLHLHALWMYSSVLASKWTKMKHRPRVITPNGMLEPWALNNSAWKKKLAGILYEDSNLNGAACLQANTEKELADFRSYGLKNPVAIIPNGVSLPKAIADCGLRIAEGKMLLFLGRLHPKKGLVQALRAWSRMQIADCGLRNSQNWRFVIAGWDQGGHEAELKRLCSDLKLPFADIPAAEFLAANCKLNTENSTVAFVGPAFGVEKDALLRSADAFILPSFSEGLPMSVLEAWAYGLPVLMTPECNLSEGFTAEAAVRIGDKDSRNADCGLRIAENCASIEKGLKVLFEMSDAERVAMGSRGRALVEERFTWPKVAVQMKDVYEWLLGGGSPPDCVQGFRQ